MSAQELSDAELRVVVEDCLRAYCRGIDRLHSVSLLAGFHPGALLVDYRTEPMTIEAFAELALESLQRKFVATQHRISNIIIERHAERAESAESALVETYVHATHVEYRTADQQPGGGRYLHTFVGRYIDRFDCRDGIWKISHRTLRNDWSNVQPMSEPMSGSYVASGRGSNESDASGGYAPDPVWA